MYLAARNNKASVVDFLAKEGADLDAASSCNSESKSDLEFNVAPTAIHVCSSKNDIFIHCFISSPWNGCAHILKLLNRLHRRHQVSAVQGHLEVLRALIKNDVNQLAVNHNGETALHLACINNREKAALLLMKKKKAVATKDSSGKLAIDVADGAIKTALEECSGNAAPAIDEEALSKADPAAVKVFGKVVMSQFMSQDWKQRVSALKDATQVLVNWDRGQHIAKENLFDGACRLLQLAIEDKVPQVFYAVMPLLKALFNGNLQLPQISGDELHPTMESLVEALLKRAESAQARSQKEAKRAILFLAKETSVGSAPIAGHLYSFDPSTASSWRPMHARLSVLLELLNEFKLSDLNGIRLAETVDLALPGLENTSVQVRKLAMEVLCGAGGIHIEQMMRSAGKPKAALLSEFLEEYMATVKPAVIKMAKSKLVKILGLQAPKKSRSKKKKRTKSFSDAKAKTADEQIFVKELTAEDRELVRDKFPSCINYTNIVVLPRLHL